MMKNKKIATVAALAVFTSFSSATVIQTTAADLTPTKTHTTYDGDISTTDLINAGQTTWDGTIVASNAGNFNVSGSNDGTTTADGSGGGNVFWNSGADQFITYNLAGSATGYDITSIVSIYGWANGANRFAEQNYTISFATVSNPTLTLFDSIAYDPYGTGEAGAGASKVTWTEDDTNVLMSGVTAIRFDFTKASDSNVVGVIREIDVFGSATVIPEPSTIALFGFAGLALGLRRRR